MPEEKKITIVEVTDKGVEERVEAPKPKVKAAALRLTPEDVERRIKEAQTR